MVPFLKIGMTLVNFSRSGKIPSEDKKLISFKGIFGRSEHESLSALVGML